MNSLWIIANAGSGKTTALTKRVVELMVRGAEPERICCLTYTKAAASEMRARVLKFLRDKLMLASPDARRSTLEELTGQLPGPALEAHAQGLFARVLDSPTGGPMLTTIHGFCQQLLQRFPMEAGLSPHFTVLDDAQAAQLQRRARHRLLSGFEGKDAALGEALSLIGNAMGEQRFSQWTQAISSHRGPWQKLWQHMTPELLRTRLMALHGVEGMERRDCHTAFCAMPNADDAAIFRAALPNLFTHKPKEAATLAAWLEASVSLRATLIDDFCLVFLTQQGDIRKTLLPKAFAAEDPLHDCMRRMADIALRYRESVAALACAEETYAVALLARTLLDVYAQAKTEALALDYDDLIAHAMQLLANPSMLGWVMQKLDHRIDHLLIDEAQDTSGAQWSIARVLVEELMANSGGIGSGGVPRSLLVVGDEKQSIYSFQGAAPELFQQQKKEFQRLLEGSAAPLSERSLAVSYRSANAILQVVDAVANLEAIAPALGASGEPIRHLLARNNAPGRVELHSPITTPDSEKLPPLRMPLAYPVRQSVAAAMAGDIATQVRRLVDAGNSPGDILILLHKRKPLMLPLIRALQRLQLPVAGLDRLVLADHLAVGDLLALMRWCVNTADDLALAQVLRSPLIGISEEELLELAHGRNGSLWQATERNELNRWLGLRDLAPYEFLTQVLEIDGARVRFAARFGHEVHEVLDELKMQASMLPESVLPTLMHFQTWIEGSEREIKREAETRSAQVRVMTVHGAKGLEAPIVILADMASIPTTARELVFFTADATGVMLPLLSLTEEAKHAPKLVEAKEAKKHALLREYQRLLYVALTRARDQLHVFGIANKNGEVASGSWYASVQTAMRKAGAEQQGENWVLADAVGTSPIFSPQASPPHVAVPAWLSQNAKPATQISIVSAPSRLGEASEVSAYIGAGGADARARGVRLHRVLEWLGQGLPVGALDRLITLAAPEWSEAECARAISEITALLKAHPWLLSSQRFPEATVAGTLEMDGRAVSARGQIDLLLQTTDGWVIIDYKTGSHVPDTVAEVPISYLLQLKTYRALVSQLEPKRPVQTAILWTSNYQLMTLDSMLDVTPWHYQNVMEKTAVVA